MNAEAAGAKPTLPRALVVSHAGVGHELLRAVELIVGPVQGIEALSNKGYSVPQLTALIDQRLSTHRAGEHPVIIFVDVAGGSCASAALLAAGDQASVTILCGVNLPMLIGFSAWREDLEYPALVDKLIQRGRDAVARPEASA